MRGSAYASGTLLTAGSFAVVVELDGLVVVVDVDAGPSYEHARRRLDYYLLSNERAAHDDDNSGGDVIWLGVGDNAAELERDAGGRLPRMSRHGRTPVLPA